MSQGNSQRAFIDLCDAHPGLAECLTPFLSREDSPMIVNLGDALTRAEPREIDAALRTIIRTAQRARQALKEEG